MPLKIECGQVSLSSTIDDGSVYQSVTFENTYDNPVVVFYLATEAGGQSVSGRIRNLSSTGMEIFMEECDNEGHSGEDVNYIVCEAGSWDFPDGTHIEAGVHTTSSVHRGGDSFGGDTVNFTDGFSSEPVVLTSLNTYNNGAFMESITTSQGTDSFTCEQEALETGISSSEEDIGWIAIAQTSGSIDSVNYQSEDEGTDGSNDGNDDTPHTLSYSSGNFDQAPIIVVDTDTATGADGMYARGTGTYNSTNHDVFSEEDDCGDTERAHADTGFNYLAFNNSFSYLGNTPPDKATNPDPSNNSRISTNSTTISCDVNDPNGDSMEVRFYETSDTNNLTNPSFEQDSEGTAPPTGWNYPDQDGWDIDIDYYAPYSDGSQSFGSTYDAGSGTGVYPNAYIYQDISYTSDDDFYAGFWVRLQSYSDSNWTGTSSSQQYVYEDDARLHLFFYDSDGNTLQESKLRWLGDAYNRGLDYIEKEGDWFRVREQFSPPTDTAEIRFQIDGGDGNNGYIDPDTGHSGNAGIWMDDTELIKGGEIGRNTNVSSGSTTSVTWDSLVKGNSYKWFVESDDGTVMSISDTWNFDNGWELTGTITRSGSAVSDADVVGFNKTKEEYIGQDVTDSSGNYTLIVINNGDTILVHTDANIDGTYYGDEKSIVVST